MNEVLKTHGGHLRQLSDQMTCGRCGKMWDVNDPEPPECSQPKLKRVIITVDGKTQTGLFRSTVEAVRHTLQTKPGARNVTARVIK